MTLILQIACGLVLGFVLLGWLARWGERRRVRRVAQHARQLNAPSGPVPAWIVCRDLAIGLGVAALIAALVIVWAR
jgi:NhaP-type Na+/H+ or K+/H+ antiporter